MEQDYHIITFLGLSVVIKVIFSLLTSNKKPKDVEKVGYISRINLFPGKSLKGIELLEGQCTQEGLRHVTHVASDRCLIIVKDGTYVRPCDVPKMVLIGVALEGSDTMILTADGAPPISISLRRDKAKKVAAFIVYVLNDEMAEGQDCGDDVARWLSDVLKVPGLRLMLSCPELEQRKLTERGDKWTRDSKPGDQIAYNNTHPFMILSESGMRDYEQQSGEKLSIDRFRPNFIVTGCPPFDEDTWGEIWIGDVKFSNHKPCHRCANTTVDPQTGLKHARFEPLKTLNKYRDVCADFPSRGIYGALLCLDSADGRVHQGDAVYVRRRATGVVW